MKPVILDEIEEHLGKVYVSGVAGIGIQHPVIQGKYFDMYYAGYIDTGKPAIILTPTLDEVLDKNVVEALKKRRILLVVPKSLVPKIKELGLSIDGVLLYGTEDFWFKLVEKTPLRKHIKRLVRQFKGHVALLRILGMYQTRVRPGRAEYQDVSIYYEYGLPGRVVETIFDINFKLLNINGIENDALTPVSISVRNPLVARLLKLVHPRAVTIRGGEVEVSAFF